MQRPAGICPVRRCIPREFLQVDRNQAAGRFGMIYDVRLLTLRQQGISAYRPGRGGVEEANVRMIAGGCR